MYTDHIFAAPPASLLTMLESLRLASRIAVKLNESGVVLHQGYPSITSAMPI